MEVKALLGHWCFLMLVIKTLVAVIVKWLRQVSIYELLRWLCLRTWLLIFHCFGVIPVKLAVQEPTNYMSLHKLPTLLPSVLHSSVNTSFNWWRQKLLNIREKGYLPQFLIKCSIPLTSTIGTTDKNTNSHIVKIFNGITCVEKKITVISPSISTRPGMDDSKPNNTCRHILLE